MDNIRSQKQLHNSPSQFEVDFIELVTTHFRRVIKDTKESLDAGIWYGSDYYTAAHKLKRPEKLQKFVEEGSFFHGYAAGDVMDYVPDLQSPTGNRIYSYRIKKDVSPSEALTKIEMGPSILDCGNVYYLAVYYALKDMLSEEKFNHLCAADSDFPMYITSDTTTPLLRLHKKVFITGEDSIKRGDYCYFSNINDYVIKHVAGDARGLNAFCYQETPKRYLVFGLSPLGVRRTDVECDLWHSYNTTPLNEGFYPSHLLTYMYKHYVLREEDKSRALVHAHKDKHLTRKEFDAIPPRIALKGVPTQGKLRLWVYRFDFERLMTLEKTHIKNIRNVIIK